jgi:hypothetical protein
MKRFRRRPMRARLAILAMIGLLWSQLVLAAHPLCSMAAMAMSEVTVVLTRAVDDCHHGKTFPAAETLCMAHCSKGDQTNDVARVPAIPALPPAAPAAIALFVLLPADSAHHPGLPPPISWHRPTAHPAALLLI